MTYYKYIYVCERCEYRAAAASTRVLVTFYFRLQFLQSTDELLECTENLGLRDYICNLPACIDLNLYTYRGGPRYADPPPVLRNLAS